MNLLQLRHVKRTLLYVLTQVVTPLLSSVAPKHMVLTALTDTLYAQVVLIFPMIIYTDSASRPLLSVQSRQSITHRAWESKLLSFFPLIVIPFKPALIYCVLNYAVMSPLGGKQFQSSSAFLALHTRTELVIKIIFFLKRSRSKTFQPELDLSGDVNVKERR